MTYSSAGSLGIQGVEAIVELKLIFLFFIWICLDECFLLLARGGAQVPRRESRVFFFFFDGLRKFLVFVGRCVCLLMCSFVVVVVVVFVFLFIYFSLVYF